MAKMELIFQEGIATIRQTSDAGVVSTKFASHQEVLDALSQQVLSTPLLPEGTTLYARSGGHELVALVQEPSIRDFIWRGHSLTDSRAASQTLKIPFPRLLFLVKLRYTPAKTQRGGSNLLIDARCYALRGSLLSHDDRLYTFPFGNVSQGGHGSICWGGNQPMVTSLRMANSIPSQFLGSAFNGDLMYTSAFEDLRHIVQKELTTFPLEKLRQEWTFQSAWNELMR